MIGAILVAMLGAFIGAFAGETYFAARSKREALRPAVWAAGGRLAGMFAKIMSSGIVALRYAAMVCGADSLAITLLDVLSGFDEIKLCTAYKTESGEVVDRFPPDARLLEGCTPVYESHAGWAEEIDQCRERSRGRKRSNW